MALDSRRSRRRCDVGRCERRRGVSVIRVSPSGCSVADLAPAVEWLRAGKIVAFPTDTFYGLAVNPLSDKAVHSLFELKGRRARAALPLVAASSRQVEALCGP